MTKKETEINLAELINSRNIISIEITDITNDPDFYRVHDHGRLTAVHIYMHSRWNSQDHGRLSIVHISKHSYKNL